MQVRTTQKSTTPDEGRAIVHTAKKTFIGADRAPVETKTDYRHGTPDTTTRTVAYEIAKTTQHRRESK